jgi:hypothetical protein
MNQELICPSCECVLIWVDAFIFDCSNVRCGIFIEVDNNNKFANKWFISDFLSKSPQGFIYASSPEECIRSFKLQMFL